MYPFDLDDLPALVYLLVFALVSGLISSLTGASRRAATVNRPLVARELAARPQAEADSRATFLTKVSHELCAPLQAMSMWAHLLGFESTTITALSVVWSVKSEAMRRTDTEGK
jgi:signal transduction histidine kinase